MLSQLEGFSVTGNLVNEDDIFVEEYEVEAAEDE